MHDDPKEIDMKPAVMNIKKNQDGQAMVEFVLVAPILLLLVFGIVQLGILFNNYETLTDAVRAGARQAAVSRTLTDPTGTAVSRVRSSAANLDTSADVLEVTVDPYDPKSGTHSWAQGGDVTVTATYPYSISLLGIVVKAGKLTSQTTERVE
jgi:Flp pilus assembly protein TadG